MPSRILSFSSLFLSLTGFVFSYFCKNFVSWLETGMPVTPNSHPFSSVAQEVLEFLSLVSGKCFKDKLIDPSPMPMGRDQLSEEMRAKCRAD